MACVLVAAGGAAAAEPRPAAAPPRAGTSQEGGGFPELEELLAAERAEADRLGRRGELSAATRILRELLADDPGDAASRTLLARLRFGVDPPDEVLEDALRAFEDALDAPPSGSAELLGRCARNLARFYTELGRPAEALEALERAGGAVEAQRDPRDAWVLGRALEEAGRRAEARAAWRSGAATGSGGGWRELLAKGRCERRLGRFTAASVSLVRADREALREGGAEPDVLAELAGLYFEVDGEVDLNVPEGRLPGVKYKEALAIHPAHEGALLGLTELHRFNWRRQSRSAGSLLEELLEAYPHSVGALLTGASMALDNGHLPRARHFLGRLRAIAPGRRAVHAEEAALAWVEHRRDEARALLSALAEADPADAGPELVVGRHLLELYRFAEARPFLESAAERDPKDPEVWTQLGRALANSGREPEGLEALERAEVVAAGRQNAWRHNTRLVLSKIRDHYEEHPAGEHTFVWEPAAADVLATYVEPFYAAAREELATRYGFTPGEVRIEFFGEHHDFSVRSTGFRGFPALGVCFGPVVTAVSPLAEMRGSFSWARTAYHEYTHVIHLGLSHNRCPRWITEGIATWEEGQKNAAWWRNMRRELVDARANGELIPVRELNAAFRGERILFGYYQGGLLVQMLVRDHGFSPMIRLLEAFDRGLDLDGAFDEVFGLRPEEVDRRFARFVDEKVGELHLEPRWSPSHCAALRFELGREAPDEASERAAWAEGWCTIAWGAWQRRRRIDAEEALRRVEAAGALPPRGSFLRGEIALARGDHEEAVRLFERGLADGGEDFRVRIALGSLVARGEDGDDEAAERHFRAAEASFPGFPEPELSAELQLVRLLEEQGRTAEAMAARERWLRYNAGELPMRLVVADWHRSEGRFQESAALYAEANEVDPFHSGLHHRWGLALSELEAWEEAARELKVALAVPAELDADPDAPFPDEVRAEILGLRSRALLALERPGEADESARAALELDPGCESARETLERLP